MRPFWIVFDTVLLANFMSWHYVPNVIFKAGPSFDLPDREKMRRYGWSNGNITANGNCVLLETELHHSRGTSSSYLRRPQEDLSTDSCGENIRYQAVEGLVQANNRHHKIGQDHNSNHLLRAGTVSSVLQIHFWYLWAGKFKWVSFRLNTRRVWKIFCQKGPEMIWIRLWWVAAAEEWSSMDRQGRYPALARHCWTTTIRWQWWCMGLVKLPTHLLVFTAKTPPIFLPCTLARWAVRSLCLFTMLSLRNQALPSKSPIAEWVVLESWGLE